MILLAIFLSCGFFGEGNTATLKSRTDRHRREEAKCPIPKDQEWTGKNSACTDGKTYHCFEDENGEIANQGCYTAKQCNRGAHPVVEGSNVECRVCPTGSFQGKEDLWTYKYSYTYCQDHKPCKSEYGKEQCRAGTAEYDIGCRCAPFLGYSTRNHSPSDCTCFTVEDICDCEFTGCPNGTVKDGSDRCVPTLAPTATTAVTNALSTTTQPVIQDESTFPAWGIVLLLLAVIPISVLLVVVWRKRRNLRLWCNRTRYKLSPPEGPVVFSSITEDSISLTWKPSRMTGGLPLKAYVIEVREEWQDVWNRVTSVDAKMLTCTATNLTEGTSYLFRVLAENERDTSIPLESDKVIPRKPKEVPSEPTGPVLFTAVLADAITMAWSAPSNDGRSPLTFYRVEMCVGNNENWVKIGKTEADCTYYTAKALAEFRKYRFRVRAVNEVGSGEPLLSDWVQTKKKTDDRVTNINTKTISIGNVNSMVVADTATYVTDSVSDGARFSPDPSSLATTVMEDAGDELHQLLDPEETSRKTPFQENVRTDFNLHLRGEETCLVSEEPTSISLC